jgi:hypothetical protein
MRFSFGKTKQLSEGMKTFDAVQANTHRIKEEISKILR